MYSDIKALPFTGKNVKNYLPSIARLRVEIFRDFPFLQEKTIDAELDLLKKYIQCEEAIVVIVFDGSTIVGASTGIPFHCESEAMQRHFQHHRQDPASFFFFSESLLLKPYRGRGIGHHFFDLREEHVLQLKQFPRICFCSIIRPADHPKKPIDYMPLNDFWRKRGYTEHPEMQYSLTWQDHHEKKPTEKSLIFWIRELT
jgi:hypothetical protein